jgi:hypothetical protein
MADQRHVDAHDPCGAKPLQDSGDREQRQRVREHAKQRRDREQQESRNIDAAVVDDFAERSERQQRNRDRELVSIDDPDRKRRAGVKIARNRGQRHIGDRSVHHRHDQPDRDRHDRPAALWLWQAVGGTGWRF